MELVLGLLAQLAQDATGLTQRGAQPLGKRAKRCAIADGARRGDAIEIIGRDQLGVHREGDRRRYIELSDLVPHITGDKLNGGSHFWHDTLGFLDTLHTALAEPFVLGNGANVRDVPLNIGGDEWAVSAHPALEIDKMIIVADATDVRLDLLTLLSETLMRTTRRFECLLGLLQAHGLFWGTARPGRFGLVTGALQTGLYVFELLLGFG